MKDLSDNLNIIVSRLPHMSQGGKIMIKKNAFPILEFDDDSDALISPFRGRKIDNFPSRLVITFFPEVIDRLLNGNKI
jgi:hypothetical protein